MLLQCRIKLLQCFSIPLPEWSYFNLICILRLLGKNQIPIFLAKSAGDDDCGIKPHQFGYMLNMSTNYFMEITTLTTKISIFGKKIAF